VPVLARVVHAANWRGTLRRSRRGPRLATARTLTFAQLGASTAGPWCRVGSLLPGIDEARLHGTSSVPGRFGHELPAVSYDCVMTEPDAVERLPSPSSALLQLARLKAGMSQRELAERAGVPVTMISSYERDQRQPTLATLLRLLRAAGFDLRLHLAAYDPHDEILAGLEASRSEAERDHRDRQLRAWRDAVPADGAA